MTSSVTSVAIGTACSWSEFFSANRLSIVEILIGAPFAVRTSASLAMRSSRSFTFFNSFRSIETISDVRLSTMTRPFKSKIRPRGASVATVLVLFAVACTASSGASSACKYQSRANSAMKHAATTTPRRLIRRRGEVVSMVQGFERRVLATRENTTALVQQIKAVSGPQPAFDRPLDQPSDRP
ncbi:unannotated protein [freshwater metagenome]|uniref:Unannotated protein n=1 Tax=freshwater metagenome TaxID=449393 RepID=A0A6J6BSW8_9ZZZZ